LVGSDSHLPRHINRGAIHRSIERDGGRPSTPRRRHPPKIAEAVAALQAEGLLPPYLRPVEPAAETAENRPRATSHSALLSSRLV
jgi:hypothetical protein